MTLLTLYVIFCLNLQFKSSGIENCNLKEWQSLCTCGAQQRSPKRGPGTSFIN